MNIIVKMKFGSHLYGTATPDSDTDYKGIFLPTMPEVLLGRIPKSLQENTKTDDEKNTAQDIDVEIYSLHYFIKLACEGQTVALDMLHAPNNMIAITSPIWKRMVKERHRFYTKNLSAFVGYARKQAAKYGIKGSRLSAVKSVIDFLELRNVECKLSDVWEILPGGEHIYKHSATPENNDHRMLEVCGRKLPETAHISYALSVFGKYYANYGARAKQAANNENIDWKAISHAMRAAFQVREILTEGTMRFPLDEAEYLIKVKQGLLDYQTQAAPRLEALMSEVETLSQRSTLPEKVDRIFWDDFICEVYGYGKDKNI